MAPSSLPTVDLMHPTQIAKPFHRAGWIYEEKVDGWRLVATKAGGTVRLVSRNGRDLTGRFPELVKALSGLKPRAFILDGEVAVYDRAFISRFEWLRRRPTDEPATLPVYMAFDLLELDGRDLRRESLKVRRRLLERWCGATAWSSPRGASQGTASGRGKRRWPAASRASWRRTRSRATCRAARSPGSR